MSGTDHEKCMVTFIRDGWQGQIMRSMWLPSSTADHEKYMFTFIRRWVAVTDLDKKMVTFIRDRF